MVEVDYRVNDLKPASTSFKHANVGNSAAAAAFLRQKHSSPSYSENHLNFISGDELAGRLQEDFFCESDAFSDPNCTIVDIPGCGGLDMGATSSSIKRRATPSPSPPSSPTGVSQRGRMGLVLIDLRSMFLFQESHVRESINLTNCPLVSKRIQDGKLQIKEYLEARLLFDGSQDIVIYEQGGLECNVESSEQCDEQEGSGVNQHSGVTDFAKLIFKNLQKVSSKQAKIEILQGGFDSFRRNYPNHCTQGVPFVTRYFVSSVHDDESTYLNWEATEIRENIFIGALHDAKNDELLDRRNITHILNCCRTASRDAKMVTKYKYHELHCDDNLKQSLSGKLEEAFQFIDGAVKDGGKVLIHCYAGVSRSAAITIAYMMYAFNLTYQQSYRELKEKRSIVAPNINFVSQLMKFDDDRRGCRKNSSGDDSTDQQLEQPAADKSKSETDSELNEKRPLQLAKLTLNATCTVREIPCGAPPPFEAAPTTGLAAKRKMLLPLKITVGAPAAGKGVKKFDNIASAPIMPANYNPFCSAFKKANTTKNSFDSFKSSNSNELFSAFPNKCSLAAQSYGTKPSSIPE